MFWQGCRRNHRRHAAPLGSRGGFTAIAGVSALLFILGALPIAAAEADLHERAPGTIDRRLTLHWKSNTPRRWTGMLQWAKREATIGGSSDATASPLISEPIDLTPGPILVGGIMQTNHGGLLFGPPPRLSMLPAGQGKLTSVQTTEGGIAFRARADASDTLILTLDSGTAAAPVAIDFALADLHAGNALEKNVDEHSTVALQYLADDVLRVQLESGSTIFTTGQSASVLARAELPANVNAEQLQCVLECLTLSLPDMAVVAIDSWPASITGSVLTVDRPQWTAPREEGAYRLRWQLRAGTAAGSPTGSGRRPLTRVSSWTHSIGEVIPPALSASLQLPMLPPLSAGGAAGEPIVQSEFSIAVLSPQLRPAAHGDSPEWRTLGTAEPRGAAFPISRLLPRQGSSWMNPAALSPRVVRPTATDAKRQTVLEPLTQVEYSVPVAQPGQRHRIILRGPAGIAMQVAVEVVDASGQPTAAGPRAQHATGLVILRGHAVATSDRSQAASVEFWPNSPTTHLVLTNLSSEESARIDSIEIQVADVPAHTANSRLTSSAAAHSAHSGHSGHSGPRLTAMRLEFEDMLEQFGDGGARTIQQPLDYHDVWLAATRWIEVLQREGYSGAILTVASDGAVYYPSELSLSDASCNGNWASAAGPVDALELLLRMFDRASLTLIPCVRPSAPLVALEQAMIRDPAASAGIAAPSPLGGQLGKWNFDGPSITSFGIYNPANEAVAQQVGALVGELSARCTHHRCVPAVGILADERTYLHLPAGATTDARTLDEFHASLGQSAPPRAELAAWVQNAGATAFDQWCTHRAQEPLRRVLSQLKHHSLLVMSLDCALPSSMVELGRDPRILTARLHRRSIIEPLGLRVRDEACNTSAAVSIDPAKTLWSHDVGVFHQPNSVLPHTGEPLGAAAAENRTSASAAIPTTLTPLLDHEESSLAFAQLLSRSDRQIIAIGGGGMNQPGSDVRRRSLQSFAQLPPVAMTDVNAEKHTMSAVRARYARYQGSTYVYAVNQTRWPVALEMTFSRAASIQPLGGSGSQGSAAAADNRQLANAPSVSGSRDGGPVMPVTFASDPPGTRRQAAAARWTPTLAAGELLAVRIAGEDIEVADWKTSFALNEQQLAMIRGRVQETVDALARLVDSPNNQIIENGDFEQPESDGVPLWLTAQHPPGCVAIDPSVAFSGKQSVRLSGQSGQAGGSWIVSQVITPPASQRIAVSVRLRGEPVRSAASQPPLVVRMALEGTVGGTPIRKTKSISVPRNGQWSEPAERLEISLLPSLPVQSLRLTIDLMSGDGVVWVDEVSCFDQFMTSGEKTELEHLVFLAAGGASRGDWTAASRLLDSHWTYELMRSKGQDKPAESFPEATGDRPAAATLSGPTRSGKGWGSKTPSPAADSGTAVPAAESARPGLAERLKSWLPRPVRF